MLNGFLVLDRERGAREEKGERGLGGYGDVGERERVRERERERERELVNLQESRVKMAKYHHV